MPNFISYTLLSVIEVHSHTMVKSHSNQCRVHTIIIRMNTHITQASDSQSCVIITIVVHCTTGVKQRRQAGQSNTLA